MATATSGANYIPVPNVLNNYHLFKIERSRDNNEIFYDINIDKNGNLDKSCPINIYWIKKADNKIEPLTWIQDQYAYGVKIINIEEQPNTVIHFRFVSYEKLIFKLVETDDNEFKVYTKSGNNVIEVERIFIQIDNDSFWFPAISHVEIHGENSLTGKSIIEIIKP